MNKIIEEYFQAIELALVTDSHVMSYTVISMKIVNDTGKIRIRCELAYHEILEFFNYVKVADNSLIIDKYSFHWQDDVGIVKRRWDNAPHHLHLPNAPHHLHIGSEIVQFAVRYYFTENIMDFCTLGYGCNLKIRGIGYVLGKMVLIIKQKIQEIYASCLNKRGLKPKQVKSLHHVLGNFTKP